MNFRIKSKESLNNSPRIKLDDGYIYNFNKIYTNHISINLRYHIPFSYIINVNNWLESTLNNVEYYSSVCNFIFIDTIEERF